MVAVALRTTPRVLCALGEILLSTIAAATEVLEEAELVPFSKLAISKYLGPYGSGLPHQISSYDNSHLLTCVVLVS